MELSSDVLLLEKLRRVEQTVVILRGIPGSGKDTFIRRFCPQTITVCSADHYFEDPLGNYNWDASKIGEAHKACYEKFVNTVLDENKGAWDTGNIAVSNTNIRLWEITPYIRFAEAELLSVIVVHLVAPVDGVHKRQAHGVPKNVIDGMFHHFEEIPKSWGIHEIKVDTSDGYRLV